MQNARNYAKYFMQKGMDTSPNTFDGNMKLQKLLVFADLINLAEHGVSLFDDEILAFRNGCVVENVRLEYRNNYSGLKKESSDYSPDFTKDELDVLTLTIEIFGNLSAVELSELNHQFSFWRNAFQRGTTQNGYHEKKKSVVSVFDMQAEIDRMKQVLSAYRNPVNSNQRRELVNGITFYYDPSEITITDSMLEEIEDFSLEADDSSYSIYLDNGKLVIY